MFSSLLGNKENNERRGYIETMLILAFADGELEDDEVTDIIHNALRHPKMRDMSDKEFDRLIRRSLTAMDKQGLDKRIEEVCKLLTTHEMRLNAIDLAVSVAMSDGEMEPDEVRVLERMTALMGLSEADVQTVVTRYR
jgi:tellurite resistance protein